MYIKLKNEDTGDVKVIKKSVNFFLLFTAPIFGITLFKNKFNRSGIIMLIATILFLLNIVFFYIFSSAFSNMYPYGAVPPIQEDNSFILQLFYLLDVDYEDVLEFFLTTFAFLFIFITCFSCFVAFNTNRWIASNYRFLGYKIIAENTTFCNVLKKEWHLDDSDFISVDSNNTDFVNKKNN